MVPFGIQRLECIYQPLRMQLRLRNAAPEGVDAMRSRNKTDLMAGFLA
jgi:hypothetical protein